MKASDYVVQKLAEHHVSKVFGYIGGMVAHLTDSLYLSSSVEMVNTIHEQGAGFAAEGYARTTGGIGVAIATSGPGATNLLTPMASCFFDSTPVLFITGQVNTFEYKKYPSIRQCGFQETNIVDMAKPITKYAVLVDKIEDLRYELEKAIYLMNEGRKGPALIDLPMNIQRSEFDFAKAKSFTPPFQKQFEDKSEQIVETLNNAKRPIILVGNGVRLSGATGKLRQFLNQTQIPVVQSLMGIDAITEDYPYNVGMIGTYGCRAANLAFVNADVVLVLGARLDVRQIGAKTDTLFQNAVVIQVDMDVDELACTQIKKDVRLNMDIGVLLNKLLSAHINPDMAKWQKSIVDLRAKYPATHNLEKQELLPNMLVKRLTAAAGSNDVICADVGQHQMWVGQSAVMQSGTRHLSSGGLGSMGFALPCGIGASVAGKRALVFAGDGGFQMNIQELEVIKRRKLPVKIVIMNNHALGMVRGFQELYFENRFASTIDDYSAPDFVKIAEAYGIKAMSVQGDKLSDSMIKDFFANDEAMLLDIHINQFSQVEPKVLFGNTIDKMSPLLLDDEVKDLFQ